MRSAVEKTEENKKEVQKYPEKCYASVQIE
jgi:hypothetical protein